MLNEKNPEFQANADLAATARDEENKKKAMEVKKRLLNSLKFKNVPPLVASKIMDALEALIQQHSAVVANEKNFNTMFQYVNNNQPQALANELERIVMAKTGKSLNEHKLASLIDAIVKECFK